MLAAKSGFTECVRLLLEKGADPNILDTAKNSALHFATINGHVEIIKLLLAAKNINPNQENRMPNSPLFIATVKGNATLLNLLLGSKITDPNFGTIAPIFVAIQTSSAECLKLLLANKADPNISLDGLSPLHAAVLQGEHSMIETLLSYGADPLAKTFKIQGKEFSPLQVAELVHILMGTSIAPVRLLKCKAGAVLVHEAILKGEITVLKQLLAEYEDANVIAYQDRDGKTPLHWACEKEYASCIKSLLIYYPSLIIKDNNGNIPMDIAKKHGNDEVKVELQRYENATKLLKEATDGNENELRKTIDRGDVDLEFAKPDKNTVMHLCAAYGYVGCLKLLINKAVHLANRTNADNQLPIHLAAERGHLTCVQELIAVTKPGGKTLHEELWDRVVNNSHKDVVLWLHADLCAHKDLPTNLFPSDIEIELRLGEQVSFISVAVDVSLYELEQQMYVKLKRYYILEQRLQQGRTQMRDDMDLKKAIEAEKAKTTTGKTTVVFYCVQNLENKPVAQPRGPDNPNLKPITKLRTTAASEEKPATAVVVDQNQFNAMKEFINTHFSPLKDMEKELKKMGNLMKFSVQQTSNIFEEIRSTKDNDKDFVAN